MVYRKVFVPKSDKKLFVKTDRRKNNKSGNNNKNNVVENNTSKKHNQNNGEDADNKKFSQIVLRIDSLQEGDTFGCLTGLSSKRFTESVYSF